MNSAMRFIVWGTIPLGHARRRRARRPGSGSARRSSIGAIGGGLCVPLDPASRRSAIFARCPSRSTTRPRPSIPHPPRRYRQLHARAPRGRGLGARARPARVARADREGRACAHRDAEDVRTRRCPRSTAAASRARERRGKNLLFPLEGDDLVLRVHLMSAGRLRFLRPARRGRRRRCSGCASPAAASSILTEAGKKKRAGVWLVTPEQLEEDLGHLGPDALELDAAGARRDPRARAPAAPPAAPRPARARGHRARARERDPLARADVAVQGLDGPLRRGDRAPRDGDARRPDPRARAPRAWARATPTSTSSTTGSASPARSAAPDRAGRLRGAHDLLLPELPDGRPPAQGPPALAPASLSVAAVAHRSVLRWPSWPTA